MIQKVDLIDGDSNFEFAEVSQELVRDTIDHEYANKENPKTS